MTGSSSPTSLSRLSDADALALADNHNTAALAAQAMPLTELVHGNVITYSRKVFIPLTHLCRDVCHYCTFAKTPRRIGQAYMSAADVIALCEQGATAGCQEALFTLGEKPELRYRAARDALQELGFKSTLEY
ncbi:MAG: 7,8-didemethyl-8-hydroxy-5-deazariboflavin synthase, partial [Gammaproteobacteria bacterium]